MRVLLKTGGGGQLSDLHWAVALLACLSIGTALFSYLEEVCLSRSSARIVERLRNRLFFDLSDRKLSYLNSKRKMDLVGRVSGDTANVEILVTSLLGVMLRAIPTLLFILGTMFFVDFRFSLILACLIPIMSLFTTRIVSKIRASLKSHRQESVRFDLKALEALNAIELIKSLSLESAVRKELGGSAASMSTYTVKARKSQGTLAAALGGSRNFMRVLALSIGGAATMNGQLSIGDLVLFLSYIELLNKPVNELAKWATKYSKAMTSIERIDRLVLDMEEHQEIEGRFTVDDSKPIDLTLDRVSFAYSDTVRPILNRFSLTFKSGDSLAIVGESGLGKSSFVKLVNRLLDPLEGSITIGGRDIRDYRLKSLRSYCTYCAQDSFLLHASVRENIQMASRDRLSDQEIWDALGKANAAEFVQKMEDGLDTVVGESGLALSGGQEKRLSIARIFVRKDAKVFVLDEASSGLDPVSSMKLIHSVQQLAADGGIVLWVTHHLEEVRHFEKLLCFRQDGNPLLLDTHQQVDGKKAYLQYFGEQSQI